MYQVMYSVVFEIESIWFKYCKCPPPPLFVVQVKQEADEGICIKQEPEDEQELMATLLDCQIQQPHHSESQVHLRSKNKSGASLFAAHRLSH